MVKRIGRFSIAGYLLRDELYLDQIAKVFAHFKIVPVKCETCYWKDNLNYIAFGSSFDLIEEGDAVPEYTLVIPSKFMEETEQTKSYTIIDLENTKFERIK